MIEMHHEYIYDIKMIYTLPAVFFEIFCVNSIGELFALYVRTLSSAGVD